jgi:hypothetical protein
MHSQTKTINIPLDLGNISFPSSYLVCSLDDRRTIILSCVFFLFVEAIIPCVHLLKMTRMVPIYVRHACSH